MSGAVRTITSAAVSPRRARTTSNPSRTRLYSRPRASASSSSISSTFGTRVLEWEVQAEPAARTRRAVDVHLPAVRLHDVVHEIQPESVTAAIIVVAAVEPLENA